MRRNIPGRIQEETKNNPGKIQEQSRNNPETIQKQCRNTLGIGQEYSRNNPGQQEQATPQHFFCDFESDPGGPRDCSTPLYSALLRSTPLHSALLRSTPLYSAPLRSTPLHSAPLRPASKFNFIFQDFRQPPGLKTTKNSQHDTKRAHKTTLNRANGPGSSSWRSQGTQRSKK